MFWISSCCLNPQTKPRDLRWLCSPECSSAGGPCCGVDKALIIVSAPYPVYEGRRPPLPKGLCGGPGVDLILFLSENTRNASVETWVNRAWADFENVWCADCFFSFSIKEEEQHLAGLFDYTQSIQGFHFHLQFSALGEIVPKNHHGSEHTDQQSRMVRMLVWQLCLPAV